MTGLLSHSAPQLTTVPRVLTSNPGWETTLQPHGCQTQSSPPRWRPDCLRGHCGHLVAARRTARASTSPPTSASDLTEQFGSGNEWESSPTSHHSRLVPATSFTIKTPVILRDEESGRTSECSASVMSAHSRNRVAPMSGEICRPFYERGLRSGQYSDQSTLTGTPRPEQLPHQCSWRVGAPPGTWDLRMTGR
jgi:hypothetical protein